MWAAEAMACLGIIILLILGVPLTHLAEAEAIPRRSHPFFQQIVIEHLPICVVRFSKKRLKSRASIYVCSIRIVEHLLCASHCCRWRVNVVN